MASWLEWWFMAKSYPTASMVITLNGLTVTVDATASYAADRSPLVLFVVKWGDGTTLSQYTPIIASHTYLTSGTKKLQLTVTDNKGRTRTKTQSVSLSTSPVPPPPAPLQVTCPANVAVSSSGGAVAASWSAATATGGTSPYVFSYSQASGSLFPVGTTTVYVTATDSLGLVATCSFTVTVTLATPPVPATPNTPSPATGATSVSLSSSLTWVASGATTYDVAFGTANPPPNVSSGQAAASYTPTLANSTTYFWRISAINSSGTTLGPIWSFTTLAAPPSAPGTPASPSPTTTATNIATSSALTWTSTGAMSYDVAFGTSSPPASAVTGLTSASYTPALANSTTYYWRVTAKNTGGSTVGPIWSFTSAAAPTGQRILSMADLTWLGTFQSPSYIAANGGAVTYPYFTLRRIGGTLKTLWLTTDHGGFAPPNELIQVDYPGYNASLASAPLASANFRNFGNGWLAKAVGQDGRILNGLYTSGITWDDHNNCVWVLYSDVYNTSGYKDPVLIRGDITDANPDATAVAWSGPWRLSGTVASSVAQADSHQTQSFLTAVPTTYGASHLGGATVALGGSYSSGGVASPFNNVLWAPTVTPTSSTPTQPNGGADLASVCLIGGDIAAGHRGRRPGDYTTEFCDPPAGQGDTDPTSYTRASLTGYWTAFDSAGACVWLNWDTIKGVLFLVVHGRGHIWYNNAGLHPPPPGVCAHGVVDRYYVTGPESVVRAGNDSYGNPEPPGDVGKAYGTGPDLEAALYAYDPDQFVQVAGGSPWQVPVHDWAYCLDKFPNFAVDSAVGAKLVIKVNGMASDQTSRLLMIPMGYVTSGTNNGFGFYVNVFAVAP